MMIRLLLVGCCLSLAPHAHAQAVAPVSQEPRALWLSVGGGYLATETTFDETAAFAQYLETATIDNRYQTRNGALIDASAGLTLHKRWSIHAGGTAFMRPSAITLQGRIPHPFFFGQLREAARVVDEAARREVSLRAEVAWSWPVTDSLRLTLSGGPAALHVRQAFAQGFAIQESGYPYDDVELVAPGLTAEGAWGLGGTAAVDIAWLPRTRWGVGVTGRLTRAEVTLRSAGLDAGGPSVMAAVRVRLR